MFNYVKFLSGIALYFKSLAIETNFIYAWNSRLSRWVCILEVLNVGSNHFYRVLSEGVSLWCSHGVASM